MGDFFGARWWREMLTRREAGVRIGRMGALAALAASVGLPMGCAEEAVERDTLELQKEEGWDVLSTDRSLEFPDRVFADSTGSPVWSTFLQPDRLLTAWQPGNAGLHPFTSPTLVQALSQNSLRSQVVPICSTSMREAYSRGLGMKDLFSKSQNPGTAALIVDLPGPESVAFGAAMADVAEPVITFDNWPHPMGVVPAHLTLAAMVHYAQEVSNKAGQRPHGAPAVFLLDANRLLPYADSSDRFDNRYAAVMPTAENLRSRGVSGIFYVVPNEYQKTELDDLNEDFAQYRESGLTVTMLPMTHFQKPAAVTIDTAAGKPAAGGGPVYYYGGGPSFWPFFFMSYAMMSPYRSIPQNYRTLPPPVQRPGYAPVRRPTIFSSRNVGGLTGVGRQKPTGFGRVSTAVSSSGRVSRLRSGSLGRSRTGYSS
jgi:hypothetical protein